MSFSCWLLLFRVQPVATVFGKPLITKPDEVIEEVAGERRHVESVLGAHGRATVCPIVDFRPDVRRTPTAAICCSERAGAVGGNRGPFPTVATACTIGETGHGGMSLDWPFLIR